MKNRFIAFEGGEGAGKTTQIAKLERSLKILGENVVTGNDPGTTEFGKMVRRMIKEDKPPYQGLRLEEELVLTAAAKVVHMREFVVPNLVADRWVISDRFNLSSQVYEGVVSQNVSMEKLTYNLMERLIDEHWWPTLTIILDIPPEIGLARKKGGPNDGTRFEDMDISVHKVIRQGFIKMSKRYKALNCVLIDGNRPQREVFADVCNAMRSTFKIF